MNRKYAGFLMLIAGIVPASALDVVRDGKAAAEIVVDAKACPSTKTAANELQKYFFRMSGVNIPLVHQPGGKRNPLYVGRSSHTDRLGVRLDDIRHDGFKIIVTDRHAVIAGVDDNRLPIPRKNTSASRWQLCREEWEKATGSKTDPRLFYRDPRRFVHASGGIFANQDATGTLYGVYDLLERLGVRFFMPVEGLGQVVPERKTIRLPEMNVKEEPDFATRYLSLNVRGNGLDECWYKQLRQGGVYDMWPGHTSMGVMTDPRPEFIVRRNGVPVEINKTTKLPRLASPELREALAEYLGHFRRFYPELHDLPIGQPDGWGVLDDRDVAAGWDKREKGNWGRFSDYTWDFVLDVAKRLRGKYPGVRFSTMSYGYAKKPPENIARIPGDIGIYFTQTCSGWRRDGRELALRKEWEKKAPDSEFYIYDYYLSHNPNRHAPALPAIFLRSIDRSFKAATPQYKGVYVEVSHDADFLKSKRRSLLKYPVLNALPYYVHGKLTWDRNADVGAILEDYYEKFFGPAGPEMKEFYEFAESMWQSPPPSAKGKRQMVEKYFEILARAKQKAGDSVYGRRIGLIEEEMEPAKKAFQDTRSGPAVTARRSRLKIPAVNGDLDKEFWKEFPAASAYSLKDNFTGQTAKANPTRVALRWAGDSLLAGIRCMERRMDKLVAALPAGSNNQDAIYLDDNVEIYIETTKGYRVKLVVNPNGACLTHLFSSPDVTEINWLPEAVAVRKGAGFWSVEVNLGSFGEPAPSSSTPWGINVCRQRLTGGEKEYYSLSPTGGRFDNFNKHANLSVR